MCHILNDDVPLLVLSNTDLEVEPSYRSFIEQDCACVDDFVTGEPAPPPPANQAEA